jgi:hypothetical protein
MKCKKCSENKQLEKRVKNASFHSIQLLNGQSDKENEFCSLGNLNHFCQSFFHIKETVECNTKSQCLFNQECSTKVAVMVLRIDNFVKRYSNCKDLYHCEDFLLNDIQLIDYVSSLTERKKCIIYMNLQPCHFSSNAKSKSCTLNLIKFNEEFSTILDIELAISYPYKTHWDINHLSTQEAKRYSLLIKNAIKGTRILIKNMNIRSFKPKDYDYLITLFDENVKTQFYALENINEIIEKRNEMDKFTEKVLFSQ